MTPLEDAGAPKERPYGVGGLGAKVEPVVGPCLVDLKRTSVVLTGSVLADDLNEFPVARTLRIGDEYTVKRCIFPPNAAETNLYHLYCSLGGCLGRRSWRLDPGSSRRWSVQCAPGTTESWNLIGQRSSAKLVE